MGKYRLVARTSTGRWLAVIARMEWRRGRALFCQYLGDSNRWAARGLEVDVRETSSGLEEVEDWP